jgi:hypothetical protein
MEINSNFINFYQQTPFLLCFLHFLYFAQCVFQHLYSNTQAKIWIMAELKIIFQKAKLFSDELFIERI